MIAPPAMVLQPISAQIDGLPSDQVHPCVYCENTNTPASRIRIPR